MRVAVIGGGPSGLVQLKYLKQAHEAFPDSEPFEVKLFETHDQLGGVFYHHSYEDGELVSSKYLTAFSDLRAGPGEPDFFSSTRYLEYLHEYANLFDLWPHIHLSTRVSAIRRGDSGGHIVTYEHEGNAVEWACDALAICSGVHSAPNIPHVPGIEHIPEVMHSQDFKTRSQFGTDKTVMILGSGETGADLAYLAITSPTRQVVFCHRDGWIGAPKRILAQRFLPWLFGSDPIEYPQVPLDVSQITLFDSMYVHPVVRDSMIIWDYYHTVALPVGCWLCSGTSCGVDQYVGGVMSERFHASRVFFNKAWQRISNYCSYSWRPQRDPLGTRIRKFFFNTDIPPPPRVIDVAPFPTHIDSHGVAHFPLNGRPESLRINERVIKPDVVVFATGYLPSFPFLNTTQNSGSKPYPSSREADVRQIWKSDDPTVGFIGFIRPGFGAIPPLAEMQAMLFTMNLLGKVPKPLHPDDEWHYRLIAPPNARISYGVEHDSYAYQLAKDMDIAPNFTDVLKLSLTTRHGWRLLYVWAAGASFTPKFRMMGTWKQKDAADIMTHELWETIIRRENLWGNFSLSVLPMIYLGSINLYYYVDDVVRGILSKMHLARPRRHRILPKDIIQAMASVTTMSDMKKGELL